MSWQSVRVHHLVGWYSHSLMSHTDIHSHRAALSNTHLTSGSPSPEIGGFVTLVAGHTRMAYLADINTNIILSDRVLIMTACGSAATVCQVSATRGNRSSRYAMQSDIAAVKDGRPDAGVFDTYPSPFNNLRHAAGNGARPFFAVMRDQFFGPETGAPVYHWSCDTVTTGRSRCSSGVGFVNAFWYSPKISRTFGSCCFVSAPRMCLNISSIIFVSPMRVQSDRMTDSKMGCL